MELNQLINVFSGMIVLLIITNHKILIPVSGSGLGKCPNYPSMPKFNMTQVRERKRYNL